jgi:hypothetical protein
MGKPGKYHSKPFSPTIIWVLPPKSLGKPPEKTKGVEPATTTEPEPGADSATQQPSRAEDNNANGH